MAYAVITGASGGIGLCLARELAARKYDLLLIARSEKRLAEETAALRGKYGIHASYLALDLSQLASVTAVTEWLARHEAAVEILVNNAGYGAWGAFAEANLPELKNMMDLNMNAMVSLCHALIPELRKKTPSYVLNVASTAAYQAVPTLTAYAATKAFVVLFTRGLRWELKTSGISVSCLSPGVTTTGFMDRAGMTDALKKKAAQFTMTPEEVARVAIREMFRGKAEIIPGFVNWISVKLTYLVPKSIVERIAAGLYKQ